MLNGERNSRHNGGGISGTEQAWQAVGLKWSVLSAPSLIGFSAAWHSCCSLLEDLPSK